MSESRQTTGTVEDEAPEETDRAHVSDVEVGSGCTEIWEHLSEQRSEDADDDL